MTGGDPRLAVPVRDAHCLSQQVVRRRGGRCERLPCQGAHLELSPEGTGDEIVTPLVMGEGTNPQKRLCGLFSNQTKGLVHLFIKKRD